MGFDYPSQAINAVLSEESADYDMSIGVKQAIGRLVNSEREGKEPFLQSDIPSDLEITLESEVIETGETISETYNAKEIDQEIDDKLDSYKREVLETIKEYHVIEMEIGKFAQELKKVIGVYRSNKPFKADRRKKRCKRALQ